MANTVLPLTLPQLSASGTLCRLQYAEFNALLSHLAPDGLHALRLHLPGTAAIGRLLRSSLRRHLHELQAGKSPNGPHHQATSLSTAYHHSPAQPSTTATSILHGGMLNFGYSGGAFGNKLSVKCWSDASCIMSTLNVHWWFGIACRYPSTENLKVVLRDFPFESSGPRSSGFDAVVLFVLPHLFDSVVFAQQWSPSSRITCAKIGACCLWFSFAVPSQRRGGNEQERIALVKLLFSTMRNAKKCNLGCSIFACGDVNPSEDIDDLFSVYRHGAC